MTDGGLVARDFSVFYGKFEAVSKLHLIANEGEAVSLMGHNGAGKTSFLRGVMGFEKASGYLRFHNRPLRDYEPYSLPGMGIRYVPQARRVFGKLTVKENLRLIQSGDQTRTVIDRTMSLFPELRDHLNQPALTLSGGEQVMLSLAGALVTDPSLLLLDEPTEGLMPKLETRLARLLKSSIEQGLTAVVAEQNRAFVEQICSRIYFIKGGTTEEIVRL